MDLQSRSPIAKFAAGIVFACAFPLGFAIAYGADPRFLLALIYGLARVLLVFSQRRSSRMTSRILGIASSVVTLVFALFVLTGLLITPYSSYYIWLENVGTGAFGGTVSNLLVLLTSLFSGMFAGMLFTTDWVWPFLGMGMVSAFLLAFIYQSQEMFIVLGIGVLAALVYVTLKHGYRHHRLRALLLFTQMAAISILLALGFTRLTGSGSPRGSNLVDEGLYPLLRKTILAVYPSYPLIYSIPGYGYSFQETSRLGGKVVLSPAPLFLLEGGRTNRMYLSTRKFDTYNGRSWHLSSAMEDETESFVVSASRPAGEEIRLTLLAEYYSALPYTLDTVRIRFEDAAPEIETGDALRGFVLKKPMKEGTRFFLQLGKKEETLEDPIPYLQLPTDLPEEIRFLAERLGRDTDDPTDVLQRIERYLAVNYSYDLESQMRYGYDDFVRSFLFDELTGYCVHFATSFAILARLNGIPSRYTTGFLANRSSPDEAITISGYASHAWPEVWLPGQGWTVWEATPALNPGYYQRLEEDWIYSLDMEFRGLTARQLRNVLGSVRTSASAGGPQKARTSKLFALLVIPLLALLGILLYRYLPGKIRLGKAGKDRRNRPLAALMARLVRQAAKRGLPKPETVGWIRWGENLADRAPSLAPSIAAVLGIILRSTYGNKQPDQKELLTIRAFYANLKRHPSA